MATQSSSIGTAIDLWGYKWDVKEDRPTLYGWPVRLGWPSDRQKGRSGIGRPQIIVTNPLAMRLWEVRAAPSTHGLPIGATALKRLRRLLGHHRQIDRAEWWADRADDLADLTIEAFAARHQVSTGAVLNARHALFGPVLRPAGWWRAPDVASIILAEMPVAIAADRLGISASSVRRLRGQLRNTALSQPDVSPPSQKGQ